MAEGDKGGSWRAEPELADQQEAWRAQRKHAKHDLILESSPRDINAAAKDAAPQPESGGGAAGAPGNAESQFSTSPINTGVTELGHHRSRSSTSPDAEEPPGALDELQQEAWRAQRKHAKHDLILAPIPRDINAAAKDPALKINTRHTQSRAWLTRSAAINQILDMQARVSIVLTAGVRPSEPDVTVTSEILSAPTVR